MELKNGELISQKPYIYIYIGDSYKLIKDIPDKSVDLVYVDIPYLYDQRRWWLFKTIKKNNRKKR